MSIIPSHTHSFSFLPSSLTHLTISLTDDDPCNDRLPVKGELLRRGEDTLNPAPPTAPAPTTAVASLPPPPPADIEEDEEGDVVEVVFPPLPPLPLLLLPMYLAVTVAVGVDVVLLLVAFCKSLSLADFTIAKRAFTNPRQDKTSRKGRGKTLVCEEYNMKVSVIGSY